MRDIFAYADVSKYFPSTPHKISKQVISSRIEDGLTKDYLYSLIDSFQDSREIEIITKDVYGYRGTDLGSQISQITQLAVLNKLDHLLKETYKVKFYIRYMDDFLIIDPDKGKLLLVLRAINDYLSGIGLTTNNKCGISRLSNGINLLKRRYLLTSTGKVIVRATSEYYYSERRRLRKLRSMLDEGKVTSKLIQDHYQSWISTIYLYSSYSSRASMNNYYKELFGEYPKYKYTKHKSNRRKRYLDSQRQ